MSPTARTPVVQTAPPAPAGRAVQVIRLGGALFVSFATHAVLLALFFLVAPSAPAVTEQLDPEGVVVADQESMLPREAFDVIVPDPSGLNNGGELVNDSQRKDDITLPGVDDFRVNPGGDGNDANPPMSLPTPPGFGGGPGGGSDDGNGALRPNLPAGGGAGGPNPFAWRMPQGGSGSTRDSLRPGSTGASEAAVVRGLRWLVRIQSPDGRWMLDGKFKEPGSANDTAGTALGLLPFLGAGKTHKQSRDNSYDKTVGKGLRFLIARQDPVRGELGGTMYGHGIATIALCEAFGLTQDPMLRVPAQRAVNFIVRAQHERGGWRYSPGQEGDLSVTGWQIMALKSAQMAGLDVPAATLKKVQRFLDSVAASNEGYGYIDTQATPTMSAVGLLSRQFVQGWGPQNLRLIRGINANLKPAPPGTKKDAYYYYYATQVMYHFGGDAWHTWNKKMRDLLVETQAADMATPEVGSWTAAGDPHGAAGGRLMVTSLNLLTLEVYYRYLPLYYRDKGAVAGG